MAKRINVLAKYRLRKVVNELKDLQSDSKLNKIDAWNLNQATGIIEDILKGSEKENVTEDQTVSKNEGISL